MLALLNLLVLLVALPLTVLIMMWPLMDASV